MTTAKKANAATSDLSKQELLDLCHFVFGFVDEAPLKAKDFIYFRSQSVIWKEVTEKKRIVKDTACNWFCNLYSLERRKLLMEHPALVPLLSRDVKVLLLCVPEDLQRVGNGVYSVFDVLKLMPPTQSDSQEIDFLGDGEAGARCESIVISLKG